MLPFSERTVYKTSARDAKIEDQSESQDSSRRPKFIRKMSSVQSSVPISRRADDSRMNLYNHESMRIYDNMPVEQDNRASLSSVNPAKRESINQSQLSLKTKSHHLLSAARLGCYFDSNKISIETNGTKTLETNPSKKAVNQSYIKRKNLKALNQASKKE
jgi:hypothetical protein